MKLLITFYGFSATSFATVLVAVLAVQAGKPVFAQEKQPVAAKTRVELALESDQLNNELPSWRAQSLRVAHGTGPRDVREIELQQIRRFGLDDQQIRGVYVTSLGSALTATLAAQFSPTHRSLAKHGVEGTLQYEFAPAWLALGGYSYTRFDTNKVQQVSVGLEHYFSDFSLAALLRTGRSLDVRTHGFSTRAAYYYAQGSSVGIMASSGQETSLLASPQVGGTVLLLSDVRAITLVGRHQLVPQWSVSYALGRTKQGNFYQRTSARVGVQYTF